MNKPPLVVNTSPLLYLGRISQIDLIPALFAPVYIPEQVVLELDAGRLMRSDTINPRLLEWATLITVPPTEIAALPPNRLSAGEQAVIACALLQGKVMVGLDDRQARLFALELGLAVVGTIGITLKAKRAGLISSVQPLLDEVRQRGFYLHPELYYEALRLAGEA